MKIAIYVFLYDYCTRALRLHCSVATAAASLVRQTHAYQPLAKAVVLCLW